MNSILYIIYSASRIWKLKRNLQNRNRVVVRTFIKLCHTLVQHKSQRIKKSLHHGSQTASLRIHLILGEGAIFIQFSQCQRNIVVVVIVVAGQIIHNHQRKIAGHHVQCNGAIINKGQWYTRCPSHSDDIDVVRSAGNAQRNHCQTGITTRSRIGMPNTDAQHRRLAWTPNMDAQHVRLTQTPSTDAGLFQNVLDWDYSQYILENHFAFQSHIYKLFGELIGIIHYVVIHFSYYC